MVLAAATYRPAGGPNFVNADAMAAICASALRRLEFKS